MTRFEKMIENNELLAIIKDWSFWGGEVQPKAIPRDINLPSSLAPDLAFIIQGVRRGGKSTLLSQMPLIYGLDKEQCYYCNFEDPRLMEYLDFKLLDSIINLAKQRSGEQQQYFFFDEIQNVQGWEKWLHSQLERSKNRHFVITGSNSFLLSGEYASALTGRHITFELYPFSFLEYQKLFPAGDLVSYLQQGGFPRALQFDKPKMLLQEYFNDIILRDVQKRVRARNVESIKHVAKMAFDSCGSELSYRKIAAAAGVSTDTAKLYLEACEQAYLLFSCEYFSFSEKKRLLRNKKYYPIDTGLRAAVSTSAGRDLGKNLEQLVFLTLKQRYEKVYYWHEQGEVDFVVFDDQKIIPYQVTWEEQQERHHKALRLFYETFPQAEEAVFINKNNILHYV